MPRVLRIGSADTQRPRVSRLMTWRHFRSDLDCVGTGLKALRSRGVLARSLNSTGRINLGQSAVLTVQGAGRRARRRLDRGSIGYPRTARVIRVDRRRAVYRLAGRLRLLPRLFRRATGCPRSRQARRELRAPRTYHVDFFVSRPSIVE
jgi:hypothetical protein